MRFTDSILENAYAPRKKYWVVEAIGTAASLASSFFGRKAQAKAEQEARRREQAAYTARQANYLRKENESYADTKAGQAMLTEAKDYGNQMFRKAQGANAVGGGTGEAVAQQKEANNKMMSSTLRDMAKTDTARQDSANNARMANESQWAQTQANNLRSDAANESSALQNTVGAITQGVASIASGAEKINQEKQAQGQANMTKQGYNLAGGLAKVNREKTDATLDKIGSQANSSALGSARDNYLKSDDPYNLRKDNGRWI